MSSKGNMGWKTRVRGSIADVAQHAGEASLELNFDEWDLDEVVRHLLSVQHAAIEALSEIYDSAGPFFKKRPVGAHEASKAPPSTPTSTSTPKKGT